MLKNYLAPITLSVLVLIGTSCGFHHSKEADLSPENSAILAAPVGYAQVSQYVFSKSCVSCHGAGNTKGGVSLDSYPAVFNNVSGILQQAINSRAMPPASSTPLSAFQIDLLSQWIKNGAPEQAPAPGSATPTPAPSPGSNDSLVLVKIRNDFDLYVQPLVKKACMDCHSSHAVLDGPGHIPIVKGIELKHIRDATRALDFSKVFPAWSDQSSNPVYYLSALKGVIVNRTMPPKDYAIFHELDGRVLDGAENQVILNWIENSMQLLGSVVTTPPTATQYLAARCLGCHNGSIQSGGFQFGSTGKTSEGIPFLTPFDPENSAIYLVLQSDPTARKGLTQMPFGDAATKDEQQLIFDWIKQGAVGEIKP